MKQILVVLSLLFFLACSNSKQGEFSRYTAFKTEESLYAKSIALDTVIFRYPFRVAVKEHLAVVLDLHNADHFFHAFSYPEWKHIVSFGQRGQAPEEMLSAETIRVCSPDSIWTVDANKMEITRWRINVKEGIATREEAIPLDKELIRTLDICLADSGFITPDYTGENRYCLVDFKGRLQQTNGAIPTEKTYTSIAKPALAQAWRSFMDYLPEKQLLVMATQLGEVLEIYQLKDGSRKVIYGPHGEPEFQIHAGDGIPTGIMGFSDIRITNNYIYAVFHGQTFKEIMQAQIKGTPLEDGGRYLCVFDHDGNPVKRYTLDHAIYSIAIDEQTGTIIATDVNSDHPIIKLQMPI